MKPVEPTKVLIRGRNLNTYATAVINGSQGRQLMWTIWFLQAV
jgi:hypothetical protein